MHLTLRAGLVTRVQVRSSCHQLPQWLAGSVVEISITDINAALPKQYPSDEANNAESSLIVEVTPADGNNDAESYETQTLEFSH